MCVRFAGQRAHPQSCFGQTCATRLPQGIVWVSNSDKRTAHCNQQLARHLFCCASLFVKQRAKFFGEGGLFVAVDAAPPECLKVVGVCAGISPTLFHECPIFRTGSLDDCKRMHMPELRVCAFHVNAHTFQSGITAGKNAVTKILITAVADQVDVIVRDANQFTNRNFRSDRHADPATGAVLTILDQLLVFTNKKRESSKRITYNWEVSTLASEQLAALEGLDADCDCMLQIALNYGKDMHTLRSRTSDIPDDRGRIGYEQPPRQKETTIKVNELLKHLNHLDLCLKSSDLGYHHPFQCNFSLASRHKIRVRSQTSAMNRVEKNADRVERLKEQSRQNRQARQAGWASYSWQPSDHWSSGASSSWWYASSSSSSWNPGYRGYRTW